MKRRDFLAIAAAGIPLVLANKANSQPAVSDTSLRVKTPVVVSTWDSGITANTAAWPILSKGGRALDAVEAAGRASEDEPSCCVGLAACAVVV